MAISLKSRLARLKEGGTARVAIPRTASVKGGGRPLPTFLETWEKADDFLYRRTLSIPLGLPDSFDPLPFTVRLGSSPPSHGLGPQPTRRSTRDLRFFDFETTGLSGGAGTIAFLSATGRWTGDSLEVEQLFLADYPGEAAFVRSFTATLGDSPILASFNGKAFDWPLFQTRCVMNGLRRPAIDSHLDLLHTARRLWRPLFGSAALADLEGPVLGMRRGPDIPGSEIPSVYFSYLDDGDDNRLELVASHNAADVANLASLFARSVSLFESPEVADIVDRRNLARILISCGRDREGEGLLSSAAISGDEKAALFLARRQRRDGRYAEALESLRLAGVGYESLLESSRLAELHAKDFEAALRFAQAAARATVDGRERNLAHGRERRLSLRIAAASRAHPGRTRS